MREEDSNLRPLGYEPNELTNCSISQFRKGERTCTSAVGIRPLAHTLSPLSNLNTKQRYE